MFVFETRKADGTKYTPGSIRSLLSGLNCVLKENKAPFSILDDGHPEFRELCKTLDSVSSSLHKYGISAHQKSAPIIKMHHEDEFWAGIFNIQSTTNNSVFLRSLEVCSKGCAGAT